MSSPFGDIDEGGSKFNNGILAVTNPSIKSSRIVIVSALLESDSQRW